ncbi:MAG: hypothetical protein VKJ86_11830 [Synechococcus sp.]|nr:hypothetical protein [Synechococcus sp.]
MLKLILVCQLLPLLLIAFGSAAVAKPPQASEIVAVVGDRLMVQKGNHRQETAQIGHRLENPSQSLIVPGNNQSLARLVLVGDRQTYDGLILQTGPASQQTTYRFPCVVEGGSITLSWQKGDQRGCAQGIQIQPAPAAILALQAFAYRLLLGPDNPLANPKQKSFVIEPSGKTPICVRVSTKGDRQIVEVLWGEITLRSAQNTEGIKITKGIQYDQGQLTFFTPETRLNSPEMQTFFSTTTWSAGNRDSTYFPGLQKHIEGIRTAFTPAQ